MLLFIIWLHHKGILHTDLKRLGRLEEFLLWLSGLRIRLESMRMQVWSQASLSGLRIQCCHELQCRPKTQLDLALLWLWCWLAATAPIQLLVRELPYATGAALKDKKKKKIRLLSFAPPALGVRAVSFDCYYSDTLKLPLYLPFQFPSKHHCI